MNSCAHVLMCSCQKKEVSPSPASAQCQPNADIQPSFSPASAQCRHSAQLQPKKKQRILKIAVDAEWRIRYILRSGTAWPRPTDTKPNRLKNMTETQTQTQTRPAPRDPDLLAFLELELANAIQILAKAQDDYNFTSSFKRPDLKAIRKLACEDAFYDVQAARDAVRTERYQIREVDYAMRSFESARLEVAS